MAAYTEAEKMDIHVRKRWLATLDNRTRHAHAMLDGQIADNDKPFSVDGYDIMYPGDASAPGYLVYNCRCTLVPELEGVEHGTRRARDPETGEWVLVEDMSYAEWAGWKKESGKASLNDLNGLKRPATIESVNKVKVLPSSILDASGQKKLQQAHKDLLQEVIRRGGLSEVARCYDLNMNPLCDYVSQNDSGKVKIPDFDVPYIAVHNHPSGLTFSPDDVYRLAERKNMAVLTVVGNNGTAYAIEKGERVDGKALRDAATEASEKITAEKSDLQALNIAIDLIKRGESYGFKYKR